ncbi:hypothetical protein BDK51DRAFT_28757, partial [Blyttiomyces helicus]
EHIEWEKQQVHDLREKEWRMQTVQRIGQDIGEMVVELGKIAALKAALIKETEAKRKKLESMCPIVRELILINEEISHGGKVEHMESYDSLSSSRHANRGESTEQIKRPPHHLRTGRSIREADRDSAKMFRGDSDRSEALRPFFTAASAPKPFEIMPDAMGGSLGSKGDDAAGGCTYRSAQRDYGRYLNEDFLAFRRGEARGVNRGGGGGQETRIVRVQSRFPAVRSIRCKLAHAARISRRLAQARSVRRRGYNEALEAINGDVENGDYLNPKLAARVKVDGREIPPEACRSSN